MNAKETERIIAFHGMRRGAAHVRTGADGTHVALTLRPGTRAGAPMPTAACLAGVDGKTVRIALTDGVGQTPLSIDPAVILLIADAPQGEAFCAEGARGTLDRRAVEMLKRPMRALRQAGQQSSEAPQEEGKLKEMPDMVKQKPEHMEASVPAASHAPGAQAVVSEAEPEGTTAISKLSPHGPGRRRTGGPAEKNSRHPQGKNRRSRVPKRSWASFPKQTNCFRPGAERGAQRRILPLMNRCGAHLCRVRLPHRRRGTASVPGVPFAQAQWPHRMENMPPMVRRPRATRNGATLCAN